jgi:hypothetical protein
MVMSSIIKYLLSRTPAITVRHSSLCPFRKATGVKDDYVCSAYQFDGPFACNDVNGLPEDCPLLRHKITVKRAIKLGWEDEDAD